MSVRRSPARTHPAKRVTALLTLTVVSAAGPIAGIAPTGGCEHGDHAEAGHASQVATPTPTGDAHAHGVPGAHPTSGHSLTLSAQAECEHCPPESCALTVACGATAIALGSDGRAAPRIHRATIDAQSRDFAAPDDVPITHQTPPPKIKA